MAPYLRFDGCNLCRRPHFDWENDNEIPASFEVKLGKMFLPAFGTYVDGLFGIGSDKPYDWGVGVGIRFNY